MNKLSGRRFILIVLAIMTALALSFTIIGLCRTRIQDLLRGMWLIRPMLYIFIFAVWGYLNKQRIIHTRLGRMLDLVVYSNIFWVLIGTVNYNFVSDQKLSRILWYIAHIPYNLLPVLMILIALAMGHSEYYFIPVWKHMIYTIPGIMTVILVLTNNLHEFVYKFSKNEVHGMDHYELGEGYYIICVWVVLCLIRFGFIVMRQLKHCKHPNRAWSFVLTYILALLSIFMTFIDEVFITNYMRGMVFWLSLVYCAIIESCIFCGVIPSNIGYTGLFQVGTLGQRIVDKDGNSCFESDMGLELTQEQIQTVTREPLYIENTYLVKSTAITGGYLIWHEDISEITGILDKLQDNKEKLEERVEILKENYRTKYLINAYREKNRLYDEFMVQTSEKIQELKDLLNSYDQTEDSNLRREILISSFIIGSYIKRRGNMLYMRRDNGELDYDELVMSFKESLSNLECIGIECGIDLGRRGKVQFDSAMECYAQIEHVIEKNYENIKCIWIKAREIKDDIAVRVEIETSPELDTVEFAERYPSYSCSDGIWSTRIVVKKAGEAV